MTDYNRWDNFDEDDVSLQIDELDNISEIEKRRYASNKEIQQQLHDAKELNSTASEILASKAAVEALKGKRNRNRGKDNIASTVDMKLEQSSLSSSNVEESSSLDAVIKKDAIDSTSDLADSIQSICVMLSSLLNTIEILYMLQLDSKRHADGYHLVVNAFHELKKFNDKKLKIINMMKDVRGAVSQPNASIDFASKTFQEIENSGKYISCQLSDYAASFAMSIGQYATACDMSRFYLKASSYKATGKSNNNNHTSNTEHIWMIRALAFAAIGNASLARSHCHQAKLVNDTYYNIDQLEIYLTNLEHKEAKVKLHPNQTIEKNVIACIWRAAYLGSKHHSSSSYLRHQVMFDNLSIITQAHFDAYLGQQYIINLHTCLPMSRDDHSIAEVKEEMVSYMMKDGMDKMMLHDIIRRLFYEAQILYLESYYYSAEVKYFAVLVYVEIMSRIMPDDSSSISSSYTSCCLLNIIGCRLHDHHHSSNHMITYLDYDITSSSSSTPSSSSSMTSSSDIISWELLFHGDVLYLSDAAISFRDNIATNYRKILALQQLRWYSEAMDLIDMLLMKIQDDEYITKSVHDVVMKHDPNNLFSQRFISGLIDFNDIIGFDDVSISDDMSSKDNDRQPAELSEDVKEMRISWYKMIVSRRNHIEYMRRTFIEHN